MSFEDPFENFMKVILPPILMGLSTITNLIVILVYSMPRFRLTRTRNVLRLLAFMDMICGVQLVKYYLKDAFNFSILEYSQFTCKMFGYMSYFSAISAWLLVYLSIERLLFTIFSEKFKTISKNFQFGAVFSIFAVNLIFYSQDLLYSSLVLESSINNSVTYVCQTLEKYTINYEVLTWIDMFNQTLIPFFLMFASSIGLSYLVVRVKQLFKKERDSSKSISFAITLICMDVIFLALNLPIYVNIVMEPDTYTMFFTITDCIYYSSFSVKFFIYVTVYTNFRKEFIKLLKKIFIVENGAISTYWYISKQNFCLDMY